MADDILGTDTLLQAPEADTGVVAGGDGFAAVLGEGQGGDSGGVGEHVVGALACDRVRLDKKDQRETNPQLVDIGGGVSGRGKGER